MQAEQKTKEMAQQQESSALAEPAVQELALALILQMPLVTPALRCHEQVAPPLLCWAEEQKALACAAGG